MIELKGILYGKSLVTSLFQSIFFIQLNGLEFKKEVISSFCGKKKQKKTKTRFPVIVHPFNLFDTLPSFSDNKEIKPK